MRLAESYGREVRISLCGGQNPRIDISRLLYKNPTFLMIDEVKCALATSTQQALMSTVDKLSLEFRILTNTNRLTTVHPCDCVVNSVRGVN